MISPTKLKKGDLVRIIAPSKSMKIISSEIQDHAASVLEKLELKVSFSENSEEINEFGSSSIKSRISDIHDAFKNATVKLILTVIGGYNCNQLLNQLDYHLIQENPKILCGFSDITSLQNAIYARTGLISYSGPHFSTFGCLKGMEYTIDYFKKSFFSLHSQTISPCSSWSDDAWFLEQEKRNFFPNEGYWPIHPGKIEGVILGGHLSTFLLLHGTPYMPNWDDAVLFLEEDGSTSVDQFDRYLQSIILSPQFSKIQGLVLGRFEKSSKITRQILESVIETKPELDSLPILANVDFGHTMPIFTFPIGGKASVLVDEKHSVIRFYDQ